MLLCERDKELHHIKLFISFVTDMLHGNIVDFYYDSTGLFCNDGTSIFPEDKSKLTAWFSDRW